MAREEQRVSESAEEMAIEGLGQVLDDFDMYKGRVDYVYCRVGSSTLSHGVRVHVKNNLGLLGQVQRSY